MRKVIFGVACSLDGFITGPGGALDWLHFSKDVQEVMASSLKNVDTFLMGRKTWEFAMAQSGGGAGAADSGGVHTYVFSRTLGDVKHPGLTVVRDGAGERVRQLKETPGKDICLMGGGELAHTLIQDGVVDEISLNIHPVLLGSGTPLFPPGGTPVSLRLTESRVLDGGCVLSTYASRSEN